MASLIKIKRTTTANLPSPTEQGELVYVYDTTNSDSANGGAGKRLYIGDPASSSNAPIAIGGEYFTNLLDHAPGTLTASSALLVNDQSKIDVLNVDNLTLDGNEISSTDTNGNITLDPNGTGYVQIVGTNGLVLPVGTTAEQGPSVQGSIRYNTTASSFEGYNGAQWGSLGGVKDVDGDTYIQAEETPGGDQDTLQFYSQDTEVMTLSSTLLDVKSDVTVDINSTTQSTATTNGALTVAGGVGIAGNLNVAGLINADSATFSSINGTPIGDTTPSTGAFTTLSSSGEATLASATVSDLTATRVTYAGASGSLVDSANLTFDGTILTTTELDVDNIKVNDNTISAKNTNGDVVLAPNGDGTVDVSNKRITSVAEPTAASDAATKGYVDAVAEGLHIHEQAHAIITTDLATITGDTVTYDNGTNGVGATLTLSTALDLAGGDLDGDTDIATGDRIIVAGESSAEHNGIYVITSTTVLTRSADFDTPTEMGGGDFVFVTHGTTYADTGWVLSEPVDTVGTDSVTWVQFSGAGAYTAGAGLSQTGTTFDVEVAATGGIEIVNDALQLKSGVAGAGLTYTNGVVDVVGTAGRITVSADAIDIASTYIGQNTITTLGTITTGVWNGTSISDAYVDNDLTISGGTIDDSPIGGTTPSTGAFTTLSASGQVTFTNATDSTSLSTGALIVTGGVAINKTLQMDGDIVAGLDVNSNPQHELTNFIVDGGTY